MPPQVVRHARVARRERCPSLFLMMSKRWSLDRSPTVVTERMKKCFVRRCSRWRKSTRTMSRFRKLLTVGDEESREFRWPRHFDRCVRLAPALFRNDLSNRVRPRSQTRPLGLLPVRIAAFRAGCHPLDGEIRSGDFDAGGTPRTLQLVSRESPHEGRASRLLVRKASERLPRSVRDRRGYGPSASDLSITERHSFR